MTAVAAQQIEDFARDGAACLRGVLDDAMIATLRAGIDANLAAPSARAKVASRPDDAGRFVEDFCNWGENPAYRTVIFNSGLGEIAASLMQSRAGRLYHDHMLTKEPGTSTSTPWHQDQPYYNVEGRQTVSFWIPVDPVDEASTLRFVAGSHLGPWLMPRSFMDAQARWFPEGSLADLPDIDADPAAFRILGWALAPGDLVAFNMLTLHSARGAARLFGALPRRRRGPCAARLADLARLSGTGDRTSGRRPHGSPAVSGGLAAGVSRTKSPPLPSSPGVSPGDPCAPKIGWPCRAWPRRGCGIVP